MTTQPSEYPNEFARGYEAAYEEIRGAVRAPNHPSVFICPCPACEVWRRYCGESLTR